MVVTAKRGLRAKVSKLQKELDSLMGEIGAEEKATKKAKGTRTVKAKGTAGKLAKLFEAKGKTRYGNAKYLATVADLPEDTPVSITVSRKGQVFASIPWGTKLAVKDGELALAG